jgi:hypothetical protein
MHDLRSFLRGGSWTCGILDRPTSGNDAPSGENYRERPEWLAANGRTSARI